MLADDVARGPGGTAYFGCGKLLTACDSGDSGWRVRRVRALFDQASVAWILRYYVGRFRWATHLQCGVCTLNFERNVLDRLGPFGCLGTAQGK